MSITRFLTALLLITACLGQLNRLFIGNADNVVVYANDIIVAVLAVLYLGNALIVRRSWRIPVPILWLMGWLIVGGLALMLATSILSSSEVLVSFLYWLRFAVYIALFFVAYDVVVYAASERDRLRLTKGWVWLLVGTSLLMAIGGFVQLYVLPDLSVLAKYGWDPHIGRLVTAMLDPNYAGTYLSMGVAVSLGVLVHAKLRPITEIALVGVTVILVLAILLTYSRSGYLMLGLVLLIISAVKSRWLLVIGGLVALVAIISVPRIQTRVEGAIHPDASASLRIVSWQNSWRIAEDNMGLGVGFNSYRYAQDRYGIVSLDESGNAGAGADSSWIFIVATTGVVGLFFYACMYLGMVWEAWRAYLLSTQPFVRGISLALVAIMVALAAASQFNNALFYTWIMEYWWVLAGLVLGWRQTISSYAH